MQRKPVVSQSATVKNAVQVLSSPQTNSSKCISPKNTKKEPKLKIDSVDSKNKPNLSGMHSQNAAGITGTVKKSSKVIDLDKNTKKTLGSARKNGPVDFDSLFQHEKKIQKDISQEKCETAAKLSTKQIYTLKNVKDIKIDSMEEQKQQKCVSTKDTKKSAKQMEIVKVWNNDRGSNNIEPQLISKHGRKLHADDELKTSKATPKVIAAENILGNKRSTLKGVDAKKEQRNPSARIEKNSNNTRADKQKQNEFDDFKSTTAKSHLKNIDHDNVVKNAMKTLENFKFDNDEDQMNSNFEKDEPKNVENTCENDHSKATELKHTHFANKTAKAAVKVEFSDEETFTDEEFLEQEESSVDEEDYYYEEAFLNEELDEDTERMLDMHQLFETIDTDQDGKITEAEWAAMMQKLGMDPQNSNFKEIAHTLNGNNEETITFEQFLKLSPEETEGLNTEKQWKETFQLLDQNGDGVLQSAEVVDALEKIGENISPEEAEDFIKFITADGKKAVKFEEFMKMMKE